MSEMNNLKVLGLIKETKQVYEDHDGRKTYNADESISNMSIDEDELNTLIVEDSENKAQYLIHIDMKNKNSWLDQTTEFYVEPAGEKLIPTHLPKEDTFIEGLSIDPKTLTCSYVKPALDMDEFCELTEEAEKDFKDRYGSGPEERIPGIAYDSNWDFESNIEKELYERRKERFVSSYIDDHTQVEDYIKNNVFSCQYGFKDDNFVSLNEDLFTPNPERPANEIYKMNEALTKLTDVRRKLHKNEELDIMAEKKPGDVLLNKMLMAEKFKSDGR